jgi:hypothetical protein
MMKLIIAPASDNECGSIVLYKENDAFRINLEALETVTNTTLYISELKDEDIHALQEFIKDN